MGADLAGARAGPHEIFNRTNTGIVQDVQKTQSVVLFYFMLKLEYFGKKIAHSRSEFLSRRPCQSPHSASHLSSVQIRSVGKLTFSVYTKCGRKTVQNRVKRIVTKKVPELSLFGAVDLITKLAGTKI